MVEELAPSDEFYFQWHLTERCNKRCSHCYQNSYGKEELPLSELERILHIMEDALVKWDRFGSLSLTGGEPFLRASDLFSLMILVDHADRFRYYDILSNGSLLDDEMLASLSKRKKLRRVQVSLEGSTPEINDSIRGNGSYEEVLRAIRNLKKHNMTVSVMTTLSRINYHDIPHLIRLLDGEKVDTFAIERLIPEGRGLQLSEMLVSSAEVSELYKDLYRMQSEMKYTRILMYRPLFSLINPEDPNIGALCSVGNNALTIMPDGTVYPCRRLPIPIGNIFNDGLFKIWYDSEVLWNIRSPDNMKGKCRDCDLIAVCRGCRAMAYYCSGDYLAEDPQCWKSSLAP
jgi:radical SAM protein with 4Fe4S-binding SPASM domain